MYIKKVLNSQKRIQYTIDQYVKENKLGEEIKIVHKMNPEDVDKKNMAMEESDSENTDLTKNRIVVAGSWDWNDVCKMMESIQFWPQDEKDSTELDYI